MSTAGVLPIEQPLEISYGEPVEPMDLVPAPEASNRLTLRERIAGTRVGRKAVHAITALTIFGGGAGAAIAESGAAHASTAIEYTVSDTAAGGVYARYAPHTADTNQVAGDGVYPGDTVELFCGVTDGDAVGPNNHSWDFVKDLSRPNEANFWLSEHYTNSPNSANTLAPGEPRCANESSNPLAAPAPKPTPQPPTTGGGSPPPANTKLGANINCGYVSCTAYINRHSVKAIDDKVSKYANTNAGAIGGAFALACAPIAGVGAIVCGAIGVTEGGYAIDQFNIAAANDECVAIKYSAVGAPLSGGLTVDANNSSYCRN
jgi:hypothetical protein